jgi:peptide/nickel transport system substrate-binding protein
MHTGSGQQGENNVLRVVPASDLAILDPIWTTATISQDHGYMIYDTLFGMTAEGRIQPQMVDSYETSPDGKTWTFKLRDGLEFHDGQPVTSEDVLASLQRWSRRDTMGQKLASFVEKWEPLDARRFRLQLSTPYGLVLESLGKPGANVPFIMPKRVAATPADKQIDDYTGSGPFIFKRRSGGPVKKSCMSETSDMRHAPIRPPERPAARSLEWNASSGSSSRIPRRRRMRSRRARSICSKCPPSSCSAR